MNLTKNGLFHYSLLLLLPSVIILHLWIAPYTKVEESFNIQAVHDILNHGIPLQDVSARLAAEYDHITFTGAVPRTFVGALGLSALVRPFKTVCHHGKQLQMLVRAALGMVNAASLLAFQHAVSRAFGQTAAYWYIIFQASQFHVMYYASRTLPNFFAFPLVTISMRYFILAHFGARQNKAKRCQISLGLVTLAGVIFRAELVVLVLHMTIIFAFSLKLSLRNTIIPAGIASATIGIVISVFADSFFWQRFPLWPELDALLFNIVQGKSSDWGVSPWHYYFTNALPKLMMNPLSQILCIPAALASRTTRNFGLTLLYPLLAFTAMYSFLPHKEWRFVVYVVPGLTAVASAGASWIWTRRSRSAFHGITAVILVGSVLVTAGASLGLLGISSLNYPGAEALLKLQDFMENEGRTSPKIYLDNLSCQTGVTRFLQTPTNPHFAPQYDKTENLSPSKEPKIWDSFDYALMQIPNEMTTSWHVLDTVFSYDGISFSEGTPLAGLLCHRLFNDDTRTRICSSIQKSEAWAVTHAPGTRWPRIKMSPAIHVLKHNVSITS